MKFIVCNKIYDTDTSEEILTYEDLYEVETRFLSMPLKYKLNCIVYKTAKGSYFETKEGYPDNTIKMFVVDHTALKLLLAQHDADKYIELFNSELEEA